MTAAAYSFHRVLSAEDIPLGEQRVVCVSGRRVLILHSPEGIHAVEDMCPHALLPLEGAKVFGRTLTCRRHGAQFDLVTGLPLNGLTGKAVRVFDARFNGGAVEIALPDEDVQAGVVREQP